MNEKTIASLAWTSDRVAQISAVLNADAMSIDQLRAELMEGIKDMQAGNVRDAKEAFTKFRNVRMQSDMK